MNMGSGSERFRRRPGYMPSAMKKKGCVESL